MKPSPSEAKYAAEPSLCGKRFQVSRMARNGSSRKTEAKPTEINNSKRSRRSPIESSVSITFRVSPKLPRTVPKRAKCQKNGASSVIGPTS